MKIFGDHRLLHRMMPEIWTRGGRPPLPVGMGRQQFPAFALPSELGSSQLPVSLLYRWTEPHPVAHHRLLPWAGRLGGDQARALLTQAALGPLFLLGIQLLLQGPVFYSSWILGAMRGQFHPIT